MSKPGIGSRSRLLELMTLKYCITAALLGVGWFGIMIASPFTRNWFLEQPAQNLGCMIVASVVVALLCRRFIAGAHTFRGHLLRAIVLPFLGAAVQIVLWQALFGYRNLQDPELQSLDAGPATEAFTSLLLAMTGTALSFFIVIPYGLLAQYSLNRTANVERRLPGGR